jgi:predicted ATP-grasp superfamily ATP-dependent carboligase
LKVLVTDAGFKHTLGAIRALAREGVEVHTGSNGRIALSFYSKYTTKKFLYPNPTRTDQFLETIAHIDRQESYDAILPIGNETWFSFMTGNADALLRKIPAPPIASYQIACNKAKTLAFAGNNAIPMPNTVFASDPPTKLVKLRYPVIAKPSLGSGGMKILHNGAETTAYWQGIKHAGTDAVLQEFVQGDGYGFFALYSKGKLVTFFMHKRIREMPPSGGPSTAAQAVYEPRLLAMGKKLLDLLKWNGVAMVEFRRNTHTKEFELLEVNPKFWGSLDLALAAGVNFPYLATQLVVNGKCNPPNRYKATKFCWPIPDDYMYLCARPSSMPRVLSDWVDPRVKKNIWVGDLRPHLAVGAVIAKVEANRVRLKIRNMLAPRPLEFSWVIQEKLAASAKPTSPARMMWLRKRGIDTVVDLTENETPFEAANVKEFGGHYVNVPMLDHVPPTVEQLKKAVNVIKDENKRGRSVLVHCSEGLGRTGTVLACYLAEEQGLDAEAAIREVRRQRPFSVEITQEPSVFEFVNATRGQVHLQELPNEKFGLQEKHGLS